MLCIISNEKEKTCQYKFGSMDELTDWTRANKGPEDAVHYFSQYPEFIEGDFLEEVTGFKNESLGENVK